MDENPRLREWNAIDAQLLQQGALIILAEPFFFRDLSVAQLAQIQQRNGSQVKGNSPFKKPTANWGFKVTKKRLQPRGFTGGPCIR